MPKTIDIDLFDTQAECFKYLEDKTTTEVLFGGGAGGSKTFTGCLWQIHRRLQYAGTRSVIARSKLKNLKATTLMTFFEVAQDFCGLKPNEDFTYNAQDSTITFFTNTIEGGTKFITCDVARFGADKTVIILWNGLQVEKIVSMDISSVVDTIEALKTMSLQNSVQRSHIIVDEDGVGGGVKDGLSGCKGFVNGSKALKSENFQNLKTQCYFKLGEMVNAGKIAIKDSRHKQTIIEELEIIKRDKLDKDTQKLSIVPKDTMKSLLGRSPDYADALMMRMWYEVKGNYGVYAF